MELSNPIEYTAITVCKLSSDHYYQSDEKYFNELGYLL